MIKEFCSPKEVAEMLSVCQETVLRLISNGKIKTSDVGTGKRHVYRVAKHDLNSFLEERNIKHEQPNSTSGSTAN